MSEWAPYRARCVAAIEEAVRNCDLRLGSLDSDKSYPLTAERHMKDAVGLLHSALKQVEEMFWHLEKE